MWIERLKPVSFSTNILVISFQIYELVGSLYQLMEGKFYQYLVSVSAMCIVTKFRL